MPRHQLASIQAKNTNKIDLRKRYQILIIDDEKFVLVDALRASGFNITQMNDISSIDQIAPYQVLLCDIHGVGKSFMSDLGGGYVLLQAALRFPEKYLIMYTGTLVDPKFEKVFAVSNATVSKNIDPAQWAEKLDNALLSVHCPRLTWLRMRKRMSQEDMDANDLADLEQAYIRAVKSKTDRPLVDAIHRMNAKDASTYASLLASIGTIISLLG